MTQRSVRWSRGATAFAAAALAWLGLAMPAQAERVAEPAPESVKIETFVRDGCQHCAEAKVFLEKLRADRPGLAVTVRDVFREPEALRRLEGLMAQAPGGAVSVPAFVTCA